MKKTFTLLLALFAFSLSLFAGNPGVTFLLHNGKKVSFSFAEKPVIALSDDYLSVSVHGVERISYAYADVQRVVVVDDVVSTIDNVVANDKSQHVVFSFSANVLNVSGLAANESIALYATEGKLMLREKANADGKVAMNLSSFQQGIYVVRTQSGISYKLFKK